MNNKRHTMITYTDGKAVEHLHYLPYGETQVDQRATSYAARYTFSAKEKDEETGYSYFGARYYNSDLSVWLSVDPMANKYPSLSPYVYCANNPVMLVDPDGKDWYENEKGTAVWVKGNAASIKRDGIEYKNVGQYYTTVKGNLLIHYKQNEIIGTTDLNSDIGKKFSMIAAEGGWVKDANGKTRRETQYGLYIIGASMENRLGNPKSFNNNGTYESLFDTKQYNAASSSTYKNLVPKINQWKSWYGAKEVMDYLNSVYKAASGNCVSVLSSQYNFANADKILGYAHIETKLFGQYSVILDFNKTGTLIKTVQSSWATFTTLKP